jgi:hypothetical protein
MSERTTLSRIDEGFVESLLPDQVRRGLPFEAKSTVGPTG